MNIEANAEQRDGKIITFYSYKGGVGRTFTLANIAVQLARWGYKVLCVDWDLEAPGLEKYFSVLDESKAEWHLIDLLENPRVVDNWRNHVSEYSFVADGEIRGVNVICSGSDHSDYVRTVQKLNWDELYRKQDLGNVLEKMRREWKEEYDFTLIDSRTGITDIGGICTVQLPDILVPLMTANNQNFEGSNEVIKRVIAARDEIEFDRGGLLVLPVLSRFDSREEYEQAHKWKDRFRTTFEWTFEPWGEQDLKTKELANHLSVPYFSYWSFGERLPVVEEDHAPSDSISYAFQTIAAILSKRLRDISDLVRNRDSYVASAIEKRRPSVAHDVYLSYPHGKEFTHVVKSISASLKKANVNVFDGNEIADSRSHWRESIEEAFKRSKLVVFLVTDLSSKWQFTELMMAERIPANKLVFLFGDQSKGYDMPFGILDKMPVLKINSDLALSDSDHVAEEIRAVLLHQEQASKSSSEEDWRVALERAILTNDIEVIPVRCSISRNEFAKFLGRSPSYVSRLFSKFKEQHPSHYRGLKANRAKGKGRAHKYQLKDLYKLLQMTGRLERLKTNFRGKTQARK